MTCVELVDLIRARYDRADDDHLRLVAINQLTSLARTLAKQVDAERAARVGQGKETGQ